MIPRKIYEWLPTAYVSSGAALLTYFPEGIGKPSALLLVCAGVFVFNMRINRRGK